MAMNGTSASDSLVMDFRPPMMTSPTKSVRNTAMTQAGMVRKFA